MSAYLSTFETMAEICEWPQAQWTIRLRGSLSGAGLLAVASLPVDQQADYATVRRVLLSRFVPEICTFFCTCHNFFLLSSVQIIIIPACCLLCVL